VRLPPHRRATTAGIVNTQLDADKKPDECSKSAGDETLARMDPAGPEAKDLIATLIHEFLGSDICVWKGCRRSATLSKGLLSQAMSSMNTTSAAVAHSTPFIVA
jgi:hypothetical protein